MPWDSAKKTFLLGVLLSFAILMGSKRQLWQEDVIFSDHSASLQGRLFNSKACTSKFKMQCEPKCIMDGNSCLSCSNFISPPFLWLQSTSIIRSVTRIITLLFQNATFFSKWKCQYIQRKKTCYCSRIDCWCTSQLSACGEVVTKVLSFDHRECTLFYTLD